MVAVPVCDGIGANPGALSGSGDVVGTGMAGPVGGTFGFGIAGPGGAALLTGGDAPGICSPRAGRVCGVGDRLPKMLLDGLGKEDLE